MTAAGGRAGRARRALGAAGVVLALLGAAFVVRSIAANWEQTRELLGEADVRWLIAAAPIGLAGMTTVGTSWRRAIELVGAEARTADVLRWYFPTQLGKYVPGGVWTVVGRAEVAVRGGVARPAAYSSVGLSLATTYLAAVLLAVSTLPLALDQLAGGDRPVWPLLLLPAGLAILHPRILERLVEVGERVLGRAVEVRVPRWGDTVGLVLRHLPAWVLIGSATWCVARAITPAPPLAAIVFATAVSWVVGFVVVGVPGGIGVREATFAAVLAAALPDGVGPAVAVGARALFMLVDVSGALGAAVSLRRRRAPVVT